MQTELKRKLLVLPAILVGIIVLAFLVKNRATPEKAPLSEATRAVRVIPAPTVDVIPIVHGTGNVEPVKVWHGVAQVSGNITEIHPRFKNGAIIREAEVLLKIDPSDYEIAITQAKTNIDATKAQLAELDIKEKNDKTSLQIELKALGIGEQELKRKRNLQKSGTVSRSALEQEERNVLSQQQSVQKLKNSLNLYPAERRRLKAELGRLRAQLDSAQLNLDRTTVSMPFTGRIAKSNVEKNQYIRQGEVLAIVDGISKAEIEVQVPIGRISGLMHSEKIVDFFKTEIRDLGKALGISARVVLKAEDVRAEWPGRVSRISDTLDPRTRTVGIIVEVDKPYDNVQPGVRPPLVKGAFVNIEFRGKPLLQRIIIPRAALHAEQVYLVDENHRLRIRKVITGRAGLGYVVIESGLNEGDVVIISDVTPAIEGMLLTTVIDEVTTSRLISEATGGAARQESTL